MKTFVCFLFLLKISLAFSLGCVFEKYSKNYLPIFTHSGEQRTLLYPAKKNSFNIREGGSIEVHCPNGFRNINISKEYDSSTFITYPHMENLKSLKLLCKHGRVEIYDKEERIPTKSVLSCKAPSVSFYEPEEPYLIYDCNNPNWTPLYLGVKLESVENPLIFAKVCYNLNEMRIEFAHYISAKRSNSMKELYLPFMFNSSQLALSTLGSYNFQMRLEDINDKIKSVIGDTSEVSEYIYDTLWPSNAFRPLLNESIEFRSSIMNVLWWKPLRYGNWKLFENALRRYSVNQSALDVVMGTSDVVNARIPHCREMQYLSFTVDGQDIEEVVPRYIWALFALHETREEYVVIGLNSPFADSDRIEDKQYCKDDCKDFSWLGPLQQLKNNSAFGYILCCRRENANSIINNLPDYWNVVSSRLEQKRPSYPNYGVINHRRNEDRDYNHDTTTDTDVDMNLLPTDYKDWSYDNDRVKRHFNYTDNEEHDPEIEYLEEPNATAAE